MIPVIKISSSMIISKPSVISNSQWCGDVVVLIWFDLLICCVILDEDDDEEIDRLTCWVCERAFRYLSPLFVLFSQFGLMTFWNNDRHLLSIRSSTRILERHKIRERHFGWVNFVSLNYLIFSIRLAWFSGKTRQHTLCIHHTPDHTFSACFLFCPVFFFFFCFFFFLFFVMERSMMGLPSGGISWWKCTASFQCSQRKSSAKVHAPFIEMHLTFSKLSASHLIWFSFSLLFFVAITSIRRASGHARLPLYYTCGEYRRKISESLLLF